MRTRETKICSALILEGIAHPLPGRWTKLFRSTTAFFFRLRTKVWADVGSSRTGHLDKASRMRDKWQQEKSLDIIPDGSVSRDRQEDFAVTYRAYALKGAALSSIGEKEAKNAIEGA